MLGLKNILYISTAVLTLLTELAEAQFIPFSGEALTYNLEHRYTVNGLKFKSLTPDKYIVTIPNPKDATGSEMRFYEIIAGKLNEISNYRGMLQQAEVIFDLKNTNYFVTIEFKTGVSRIDYLLDDGKYSPTTRIWFNNTNTIHSSAADGDWVRVADFLGN